jgi:hypothetical protein
MKIRTNILVIIITLSLAVFSSCKKAKESKIIGTWKELPLDKVDSISTSFYWTFNSGTKVSVEIRRSDTTYTVYGTYNITSKNIGFSGYLLIIEDLIIQSADYSGKWKIFKLKNDKMQLHRESFIDGDREGAFIWKDFVKE